MPLFQRLPFLAELRASLCEMSGEPKKRGTGSCDSVPLGLIGRRLRGIVEDRGAGGEGGADGDDPLIGAAAEAEPQVLKSRNEASVHEDVAEL